MTTEKIIMVDRVIEKLSDEEMKKIKEEYAQYCVETYKNVQNLNISSKDAKDIVFQHILSPFQYFIEDKVRLRRLAEGKLEVSQQRPQTIISSANVPKTPAEAAQPKTEYKRLWKNRY